MHSHGQGPSEDLIHIVKQERTERQPRISCMLSQMQTQSGAWESCAFIHSFIHLFTQS